MNTQLHELITTVREDLSDSNSWQVLADYLTEKKNDPRGELIAFDLALRNGLDNEEARQMLRDARINVWKKYGLDEDVSDYLLQDKFWQGAFPLRFPNKLKLDELDGAFADEFPRYRLLPWVNTYALGVNALRRACEAEEKSTQPTFPRGNDSTIYRPFTFHENIQARVEDFYTLYDKNGQKRDIDNRLRLFKTWLNSCTGIAYKANSNEFKIILQSPHLIGIHENFNEETITEEMAGGMFNYDALQGDGIIKLDRNDRNYNQLLTQEQVLNHPAWNIVVDDKALLKEYAGIVFSQQQGNNMGFWLRNEINQDQLRAVFVFSLYYGSVANGSYNLINLGSFLAR